MFRYRWAEWMLYTRLINTQGLEKIAKIDIKYLEDPVCLDVEHDTLGTLTALLATVLALRATRYPHD